MKLTFEAYLHDTISCFNGNHQFKQPANWYKELNTWCGFASCGISNSTIVQECCVTPLYSNGHWRYCEPRINDTNWDQLNADWYGCIRNFKDDFDQNLGYGCTQVPRNAAGALKGPSVGAVWVIPGLLVWMACPL